MKKQFPVSVFTIGLAIFTMLFGAGNIIYPVKTGVLAGSKIYIGILGFLLTGVLLPVIGLVAMILFDGNYSKFFARIGRVPGFLAILFCMLILGPLFVMPRCILVPYSMLADFMPCINLTVFSIIFAAITFMFTYKESGLLSLLSKYMSPILIGSLGLIVTLGLFKAQTPIEQPASNWSVFLEQMIQGFGTADLIGALFFAYIIVRLIKINDPQGNFSVHDIALQCLKGGVVAGLFMAAFYIGLSFLSAHHATLVDPSMDGAQMFKVIALHVAGNYSIFILITAVLMACISTLTALAAVFAEYLSTNIFCKKVTYHQSLVIGLTTTTIMANLGLSQLMIWIIPLINIGYPIIVSIVLCNLAYSLFNFTWIKLPVAITTLAMLWIYCGPLLTA